MGKYVINGKTYYFSKDTDEDSHNKKNVKNKANKKRIKKQIIRKPKNVIKELIEKADSIEFDNYDKQINILEEIYSCTKDLSIIRKYSVKYISACIKRRTKKEAIEQFERLKSKFGASIFSAQVLIEMTKMYCDVGNFIEARKIYYSAKRYDSGKYYDELKELDRRISIHEVKSKPKKEIQAKEKNKTEAKTKNKVKTKIIWDSVEKEEEKNKYNRIEKEVIICEFNAIKVLFKGVEYSDNVIKYLFEVICDRQDLYSIKLVDRIRNNNILGPISLRFNKEGDLSKISDSCNTSHPINSEFTIQIKGPDGFYKEKRIIINTNCNKSSIEVRKKEIEIKTIDFRSFVIRSDDYYECQDHDVEAVKAIVYIFDGFKTVEKEIPAFYCNECKVFYIKESSFELLKKYGRILCPIMTIDEYWEMKNNLNRFGSDWARKSVLKMYGYSASEKDNLSDKTRRTILEYIIDSNVLTKKEVVDYLLFFIRFHQSSKKAVAKWQSDIDYITGYKTDFTKKKVGIIYREERKGRNV